MVEREQLARIVVGIIVFYCYKRGARAGGPPACDDATDGGRSESGGRK